MENTPLLSNDKISDLNNLYNAFLASKKNSSWKPEVQRFSWNWLIELSELQKELQGHSYKTSQGVSFILNERGKTRKVVGSKMRDRVVRHSLCDNVLMPYTKPFLISDNSASQKGKGLDFARKRLLKHLRNYYHHFGNKGYILLMDFSKYYDNIQHDKILDMYKDVDTNAFELLKEILQNFEVDVSYMSDDEYARCLDIKYNALEHPNSTAHTKMMKKSVNIGDQTSQIISIFFPTKIDTYVKTVCSQKYYARYMDDSYIISDSKETLWKLLEGIKNIAKELGIFLNENKTQVCRIDKGFTYLQYKYKVTETGKVDVKINKKRITCMRRKLKKLAKMGRMDINMIKSWLGGFCKVMSSKQIESIYQLLTVLGVNVDEIKPKNKKTEDK